MTQMTTEQEALWLTNYRRKRREEQAQSLRSRFRLVVNRGITPQERPVWYRNKGRL